MRFLNISRDPQGVYIAYAADGVLWYYRPTYGAWYPLRPENYGTVLE